VNPLVHIRPTLDRKRDMSYAEPLWEINGNQAPVSPGRIPCRAMPPSFIRDKKEKNSDRIASAISLSYSYVDFASVRVYIFTRRLKSRFLLSMLKRKRR
jgi:hypothetical protein